MVGGGDLAGQFADAGLLDEGTSICYIAPVTLGAGRPILPRRFDLKLVSSLARRTRPFAVRSGTRVVGPRT